MKSRILLNVMCKIPWKTLLERDVISIIHLPREDEETGSGGFPEGAGAGREGEPLGCVLLLLPPPRGLLGPSQRVWGRYVSAATIGGR